MNALCTALTALAVISMLGGCGRDEEQTGVQGYVEGEFVYMSAPAAGILRTLEVEPGDRVSSGAMLFQMDADKEHAAVAEASMKLAQGLALAKDAQLGQRPSEIEQVEARLKQAEAALVLSMKTFERQQVLFRDRLVSQEELDEARSKARQDQQSLSEIKAQLQTARQGQRVHQVEAAEANVQALEAALSQAQWNLAQTSQTAPMDALVFDTYFRPGEVGQMGRPIVSLLPPGAVKVRAFLPETEVGPLEIGTTATVAVDGVGQAFTGHVSFISPKAEFTPPVIYSREMRQKLSFMVEISFPAEQAAMLHPGQPVDVHFQGREK